MPVPDNPNQPPDSRPAQISDTTKTIMLGGVQTFLEGAASDEYFRTIEDRAAELDSLAAFIARHIPPTANVIDVGANIGLSTILLSRLVGRVIAYEPSPPNVAFLRRNLALNGITNVDVRGVAVSSTPGTLRFTVDPFGAGSHVVTTGHLVGVSATIDVPAVALDDEGHPRVAFIKLDAEGHEPDVLAGARRLLARDQPLIHMEINLWCLLAFANHNPGTLVRAPWLAFDVATLDAGGNYALLPSAFGFLRELIASKQGLADVLLRPRAGARMPTLPELSWPAEAREALDGGAATSPGHG